MKINNLEIEQYRIVDGIQKSDSRYGNNGAFLINYNCIELFCIVSDGMGWDHVSISLGGNKTRLPKWDEMTFIKNLFWIENDTVLQFHPKKSEYVNCHPKVLHLWKKQNYDHELPPSFMIGPK